MEEKNDFGRRLRLFSIGLVLGSVVVYFTVFKNRNIYKSPSEVIKEKLLKYPATVTPEAKESMDSLNLQPSSIKSIIEDGDIEFGNSEVHKKPCPEYFFRNTNPAFPVDYICFSLCDSTSQLLRIGSKPIPR